MKPESQQVKRLREFGERLAADGYPSAVVESAAHRMQQLEDLVLHQNEEFQTLGEHIRSFQTQLDELGEHALFRRQAE